MPCAPPVTDGHLAVEINLVQRTYPLFDRATARYVRSRRTALTDRDQLFGIPKPGARY